MPKTEMPSGALVLLILRVLRSGPLHGYAIAQRIHVLSSEVLRVEEGSLYPALHRLEDKGSIEATWGLSENKRQAKFYTLTPRGRQSLRTEIDDWTRFAAAIAKVITATRQPA